VIFKVGNIDYFYAKTYRSTQNLILNAIIYRPYKILYLLFVFFCLSRIIRFHKFIIIQLINIY